MRDTELRREVLKLMMDTEEVIFLVLLASYPGVVIPKEHITEAGTVGLHVGWDLPVPIGGLELGDKALKGIFSFNRVPTEVVVPWRAILALAYTDVQNSPRDDAQLAFPMLKDEMGGGVEPDPEPAIPSRGHLKVMN